MIRTVLIFGGLSAEHEVSILSARSVANAVSTRQVNFEYGDATQSDGQSDCATNTSVAVSSGPHTVTYGVGGAGSTHWSNSTMEVLYVPFDGSGG